MVGIGGVSMSPLAQTLLKQGVIVTGSDSAESPAVQELRTLGIPVTIGHDASQLGQPDCIIRTAAAKDDNPEISYARSHQIPVFERAEGWGAIMQGYKNALCIAGTHGKSTTTAMSTQIFLAAQKDPTFMLGGNVPSLGKGFSIGEGDTIIVESCEYCNSFHHFFPTVAVVLNLEADHLDFFKDEEEVKESFRTFLKKVPDTGHILVCGEDNNCLEVAKDFPHSTYGVDSGDICCKNLTWNQGYPTFTLVHQGKELLEITLQVVGRHNLLNALAAAGSSLALGISPTDIATGLQEFSGVGRRFQKKGTFQGATVVDDYAHHPTELEALYQAVEKLDYSRTICAFQPHTFTRTKAFFKEFAQVLSQFDQVILVDIYSAREKDLGEVSSQMLADAIPNAIYGGNLEKTTQTLRTLAQEGDLILTVGAGDVFKIGESLVDSQP